MALLGNGELVKLLVDPFIFGVELELSLEVVAILLLFFSQISKEEGVVRHPSLSLPIEHSPLSPLVIDWLGHCPCIELLHFIEDPVELRNGLFDSIPGLVHVAAQWRLLLVGEGLHLLIDDVVGGLESIEFLVGFLHLLQLVGGINHDTVGLVVVHVDVDIGTWCRLQLWGGAITEVLRETNLEVLLTDLEMLDGCEHRGVVVVEL
jgi:hypothetical protein